MKTEKRIMPAELKRIYKLGEALGAMGDTSREALREVLDVHFKQSHEFATDPETHPDKRAFWCGANHQVSFLREELEDLLSGNWRTWPQVKEWRESGGEEE